MHDAFRSSVVARRVVAARPIVPAAVRFAAAIAVTLAAATVAFAQTTAPTSQPAAVEATPAMHPAHPRVLVISIDGCRPDCMMRADMPAIRGLMKRGSFSLWATTTDVAITTPSHVSMLTGVTPERHGIAFNGDPPEGARIAVPTLFDLAKKAGHTTGLSSGKRKFTLFGLTNALDWQWLPTESVVKDDRVVADRAAEIILEHKPEVMLVHFPGADVAGHGIGWGTPEQIAKLEQIDQGIARVLKAYDDAGLTDSTYVIVSADHGGTVRTHGKDDPRSHFIPWICVGPGVRANYDLTRLGRNYEVRTYDTFATACQILGIPLPEGIDGRPQMAIFKDYDLMRAAEPPSKVKDPATAYMTDAPDAAATRPVWQGAGKAPGAASRPATEPTLSPSEPPTPAVPPAN